MTRHNLMGRTDQEVLWFQRRSFLQSAAAWVAAGGSAGALAQSRSNVVNQVGDASVNGARLLPGQSIQSGDVIKTGPGSTLIFTIGNSAFHLRQNTTLTVDRGASLYLVSALRLLTGAAVSVWGRGSRRQIITPTATVGIRGTGVYTEHLPSQNGRSYICNCYGVVEVAAGGESVVSTAEYHQSFWGEVQPKQGRYLTPAKAINHTDEELEVLAKLVNQQTAWQIKGRKGTHDGMGYIDEVQGKSHPAAGVRL